MLKRVICFAAAMIIALLLGSCPAFAVEYEELPPEIREYVDEVKSSAYEEGREDGYEDGSYDREYEEYEEDDDFLEDEYDPFTGARRGGRVRSGDDKLSTIVMVCEIVIFFGFILYWIIRISIELLIDKIKTRRKAREK